MLKMVLFKLFKYTINVNVHNIHDIQKNIVNVENGPTQYYSFMYIMNYLNAQ